MSTCSRIGILNVKDGSVRSVYCHSDGYPDYNGRVLLENYTTPERVNDLIELGNISSLGVTTEVNETRSYHRWRNETLEITDNSSVKEFLSEGEEYNYLFVPGVNQWYIDKTLDNTKECDCGMSLLTANFIKDWGN